MDYRQGSHTKFKNRIPFCLVTKYRLSCVAGDVALRVRELFRQTCERFEIQILRGVVSKIMWHILVSDLRIFLLLTSFAPEGQGEGVPKDFFREIPRKNLLGHPPLTLRMMSEGEISEVQRRTRYAHDLYSQHHAILDFKPLTRLPDKLAHSPEPHPLQHMIAVFGDPDKNGIRF